MKRILTPAFLIVAVLLLGSELAMRVFFARNMSGRFEYGYHPTAGFVEESDGKVKLVRAGGRRFRPQEFSQPKPQGSFRAFVVGDSVPRGPSLEKAYAWQLGQMLRDQGADAEVFNLAVGGFGVRRNQIVLKKALEYRPDVLVLHVNSSNEFEDEREWRRAQEFKSWHPSRWLAKSVLVARLYELKTEKLFLGTLAGRNPLAGRSERRRCRARRRTERNPQKSVARTRPRHHPGKCATHPAIGKQGRARYPGHAGDGWQVGRTRAGRGVSRLGRTRCTSRPEAGCFGGPGPEKTYADGAHLRQEGHRLLAAELARQLIDRRWVTFPPNKN